MLERHLQLLPWKLDGASQHHVATALKCVCEYLCFISIYFVYPLARCVLRKLLLRFVPFQLRKCLIGTLCFWIAGPPVINIHCPTTHGLHCLHLDISVCLFIYWVSSVSFCYTSKWLGYTHTHVPSFPTSSLLRSPHSIKWSSQCYMVSSHELLYTWKWKSPSHVWLFVAPWTVGRQAPLSVEFSRQEYWSG